MSSLPARRFVAPLVTASVLLASAAHAQNHDALEEIIVTGVLRDRAVGELAQSITVISGDALERIRANNLGETLANQLGVSSSYFGAGASRPIIRGLAGARVQMLAVTSRAPSAVIGGSSCKLRSLERRSGRAELTPRKTRCPIRPRCALPIPRSTSSLASKRSAKTSSSD
jgi:hypothetical protein